MREETVHSQKKNTSINLKSFILPFYVHSTLIPFELPFLLPFASRRRQRLVGHDLREELECCLPNRERPVLVRRNFVPRTVDADVRATSAHIIRLVTDRMLGKRTMSQRF
jgi:hypothetical protein